MRAQVGRGYASVVDQEVNISILQCDIVDGFLEVGVVRYAALNWVDVVELLRMNE